MSSLVNAIQFTNFLVGIAAIILIGTVITVLDKWWDEIEPVMLTITTGLFFAIIALCVVGFVCWCLVMVAYLGAFIISLI